MRDDRFGVRGGFELRQTVSKVANAGEDQFLCMSLSVSPSVSTVLKAIPQTGGKWSTYIGLGDISGRLDPLDGPTQFFDGIDEGAHVSSNIVEQVDRRHCRTYLAGAKNKDDPRLKSSDSRSMFIDKVFSLSDHGRVFNCCAGIDSGRRRKGIA